MPKQKPSTVFIYQDAVDRKNRFWDLRSPDGNGLLAQAPLIIHAVMFAPNSVVDQLERIQTSILDAAGRLSGTVGDQFFKETQQNYRAVLSGAILLTLLRLDDAGYRASLNSASLLLSEIWVWDDETRMLLRGLNVGKQRDLHLKAWRHYRPAAHLLIRSTICLSSARSIR